MGPLTRRQALAAGGLLLAGAGATTALETRAFTTVDAGRDVGVTTVDDPNAIIGLSISDPVKKNNQEPLVDIENNTTETLDVTVSLDDCTLGTLYDADESGCTVTLTIDPGVIKTVDIEATDTGTITFSISATSTNLSFDATRQTNAETGNTGPTANAGGPYSVDEGDSIELDGSGSSGTSLSYSWRIVSGEGSLDDASTETPVYNAPSVESDTTVTVELTVTDNQNNTDSDQASITVNDVPGTPTIDNLTVSTTGNQNRKFRIEADVSDPDGNLDRVEIVVIRTKNGNTAYSSSITVSGGSDSISDTTDQLKNNKEYRIEVTVYDQEGNNYTETRTKTTG